MVSQFSMTLKYYFAYSNRFRSVKCSNRAIRLGHFDSIVPSLACILTKQHGVRVGKYLWKTSGNTISETLIFRMPLQYYASALKNLCLWCEFQSCLLFIITLLACLLFDSPVCWIVIYPRDNAIQCLNKQGLGEEKD